MNRSISYLSRGLLALALLAPVSVIAVTPVAAAHSLAATTTCNNGVGNGGGKGIICEVTITNSLTATGGSATVKVHECLGSAGAPLSGVCSTTTRNLSQPVTNINQCNGSVGGGGSTLRCHVVLTNNFYGVTPGSTSATVNQCVGSGAGGIIGDGITGNTIKCDPVQSTDNAAITQCNGSANGGTLVHLNCTASGTMASSLSVVINQCNGSANGGGALVECTTTILDVARELSALPTLAQTSTGSNSPSKNRIPLLPRTSTGSDSPSNNPTPLLPLMLILALGGLGLMTFFVQKRSLRS
jgi:hypothetical protein